MFNSSQIKLTPPQHMKSKFNLHHSRPHLRTYWRLHYWIQTHAGCIHQPRHRLKRRNNEQMLFVLQNPPCRPKAHDSPDVSWHRCSPDLHIWYLFSVNQIYLEATCLQYFIRTNKHRKTINKINWSNHAWEMRPSLYLSGCDVDLFIFTQSLRCNKCFWQAQSKAFRRVVLWPFEDLCFSDSSLGRCSGQWGRDQVPTCDLTTCHMW